ncbi:MAG: RsmD family RNA methyltransferase [Myxococcales bacterium]|nr:RsmD family RNA methyltransferase [Myxococcales bacterium]
MRDVGHAGDAVVETEAGIVMLPGALPGERIALELAGRRRGVLRGRLLSLLEPSPDRVQPSCELADSCGGCPLMSLSAEARAKLKQRRVLRALHGLTGAPEALHWHPSPLALGYRRRARLAFSFSKDQGQARLGYRRPASHQLVDAPHCPILAPPLADALSAVRQYLLPELRGSGELELGVGAGERGVAVLHCQTRQPPALLEAARRLVESQDLAGLLVERPGAPALHLGDPRQCVRTPEGDALWADASGFVQGHGELNRLLVERVLALSEPEGAAVLELYAGHGNFTAPLARRARTIDAVERDPKAAEHCRQNLAAIDHRARVQVHAASAADLAANLVRVDLVVLDPPRSGARDALVPITALSPARIVYVSCDPATLRRDLQQLAHAGYRLDHAEAFDLFPHTTHVETLVRLTRSP